MRRRKTREGVKEEEKNQIKKKGVDRREGEEEKGGGGREGRREGEGMSCLIPSFLSYSLFFREEKRR